MYGVCFFLTFFICGVLSSGFAAQTGKDVYHCIREFENGEINWSTGSVKARGRAESSGKKGMSREFLSVSARSEAVLNLIEILKKIIRTNNVLGIKDDETVLAGIEEIAKNAIVSEQRYYVSVPSVEMVLETRIFGSFLNLVLPEEIRRIPDINSKEILKQNGIKEEGLYTGLILDARGLDFEPVLYPVVVSEQGGEVYSSVFISREFAVEYGICKYFSSIESALGDQRVGKNPFVFKGLRRGGKENSYLIISMSDAKTIEKAAERHAFFKECRLIIVAD